MIPATNAPKGEAFDAQARQAFENLSTVLQAAGSGLQYVVKTTIFMADAANFAALNQLFKEYFPTKPPARSVPIVQLPRGLLISIEAVAVLPMQSKRSDVNSEIAGSTVRVRVEISAPFLLHGCVASLLEQP